MPQASTMICFFYLTILFSLLKLFLNLFVCFEFSFRFYSNTPQEVPNQSPCLKRKCVSVCFWKKKLNYILIILHQPLLPNSLSCQTSSHGRYRSLCWCRWSGQRHGGAECWGEDSRVRCLCFGSHLLCDGPAGHPHLQHPEEERISLHGREGSSGRRDSLTQERRWGTSEIKIEWENTEAKCKRLKWRFMLAVNFFFF